MTTTPTAEQFIGRLDELRRTRPTAVDGDAGGVAYRHIFALAKELIDTAPDEIELLLDHPDHDMRLGAVSIMDFQARRRTTPPERRRELYELYVRRHDRIDNWDLVDRAAPHVVGGYLDDKQRDQLYTFARSSSQWERRTAIVATYYFIRHDDLDDTFAIAELLIDDPADLVQKAVGGWLREAGKHDAARLVDFLDRHAATMNRTALRYAIEHFEPDTRQHYMNLGPARPAKRNPAR